jgi:3-hydroxybutyrate dehydrogenase
MILDGKHALVTGGGTGIGLAIATTWAQAGARVTITGRRGDVLDDACKAHANLHAATMDVQDESQTRSAIATAAKDRGPIDICIANAGIATGRSFRKMDMDHWRQIQSTNLDGAFVTIQAAMETMQRDQWARIIGVASIAGVRGLRGAIAYTASKHGLVGLIRGLSEEYMGSNMTFNALCPGYVDTDIVTTNATAIASATGMSEADATQTMARANRHKKLLDVDEIAQAALWLCGPGSQSINGQTIQIAGGQVS